MNNEVTVRDAVPLICEKLSQGGSVTFTPGGHSMRPMLSGSDPVVLKKYNGSLKKYDLPFYRRPGTDLYIIHRVVGFDKDGSYVLCGDFQLDKEHGVRDEDIIGVVSGYYKGSKYHSVSSLYCRAYARTTPVLRAAHKVYCKIKGVIKKGENSEKG